MYSILIEDEFGMSRDELMDRLIEYGIETRTFFVPMHEQSVFQNMGLFKGESYPIAEDLARTGMYLPSSLGLKKKEKMDANEIERKCFRREKSMLPKFYT
jgi:perosamine synthetase